MGKSVSPPAFVGIRQSLNLCCCAERTSPELESPGLVPDQEKCELPWSPLFTPGEFERPPRTPEKLPLTEAIRCSRTATEVKKRP